MWLRNRCLFLLIATSGIFLLGASGAWANDTEGFFAGIRFGHELADVEHAKSVHYNAGVLASHPDGSSMATEDNAKDGINAFSANLGYRAFLSDRIYLSGEVEGAVYSNTVQGFLRGTYRGDARPIPSQEVFPGAWSVGKEPQLRVQCTIGLRAPGF